MLGGPLFLKDCEPFDGKKKELCTVYWVDVWFVGINNFYSLYFILFYFSHDLLDTKTKNIYFIFRV
jgi:hypothetical protein